MVQLALTVAARDRSGWKFNATARIAHVAGLDIAAALLAVLMQPYSIFELGSAVRSGFSLDAMAPQVEQTEGLTALMNRGGVYSMAEPIFIAFFVFFYVGVVDAVSAIPRVIRALLTWSRSVTSTALTALFATGAVNALTSNQYATSFIVGDAFRRQFDERGIDRRVLSRSLEDYGTMLESLVPWTTTTLFMVATLGVAWEDYVRWQILSLANLAVAPLLLALGIGMFKSFKGWMIPLRLLIQHVKGMRVLDDPLLSFFSKHAHVVIPSFVVHEIKASVRRGLPGKAEISRENLSAVVVLQERLHRDLGRKRVSHSQRTDIDRKGLGVVLNFETVVGPRERRIESFTDSIPYSRLKLHSIATEETTDLRTQVQ